jgi:hypothetical protein
VQKRVSELTAEAEAAVSEKPRMQRERDQLEETLRNVLAINEKVMEKLLESEGLLEPDAQVAAVKKKVLAAAWMWHSPRRNF